MKVKSKKDQKAFFQDIGDMFRLPGEVKTIEEIREAKTNSTYRVTYSTNREYVFQQLNVDSNVNLENVMKNIDLVTSYLRGRSLSALHFHHSNLNKNFIQDSAGNYWRVRRFIDAYSYKATDDLGVIEDIGFVIGDMLNSLKDFDISLLTTNFENVHKTRDIIESLKTCDLDLEEKDYLLKKLDQASCIYDLYVKGDIKPRVAHNDAKVKNVLFNKQTRRPSVLIDIEMVQPGIGLYDFASSAIYLCNDVTIENDEITKTEFNLKKFEAFVKGYLKVTKFVLTDIEKEYIGKTLYAIACEAAAFNVSRYSQNGKERRLAKARMYTALAKDIDSKVQEIEELIKNTLESIKAPYRLEINALDRDISIDKQKDYKPGEYMNIVMPHNIKPRGGKAYAFFKRAFDIFCSLLALILLSPILLIVGLLVKLTSKGPMIYVSKRVGKNGRIFKFYKFRSMYQDAESRLEELLSKNEVEGGITFKMKNDPRITPFGRFIRKTSLDELPQLVNILKGDMTLIGPRVGLPREIEQYPSEALDRLLVPQGLSGEWQANGRSDTTFDQMIKMDLDYIQNKRSFWHDIGLIFKTVWVVIAGKGAE